MLRYPGAMRRAIVTSRAGGEERAIAILTLKGPPWGWVFAYLPGTPDAHAISLRMPVRGEEARWSMPLGRWVGTGEEFEICKSREGRESFFPVTEERWGCHGTSSSRTLAYSSSRLFAPLDHLLYACGAPRTTPEACWRSLLSLRSYTSETPWLAFYDI